MREARLRNELSQLDKMKSGMIHLRRNNKSLDLLRLTLKTPERIELEKRWQLQFDTELKKSFSLTNKKLMQTLKEKLEKLPSDSDSEEELYEGSNAQKFYERPSLVLKESHSHNFM